MTIGAITTSVSSMLGQKIGEKQFPGRFCFPFLPWSVICSDERQQSRLSALAGIDAIGSVEQQAVRGFHFYAESLRARGGVSSVGSGDVDGVRLGVLADAGLFARAVCGGG